MTRITQDFRSMMRFAILGTLIAAALGASACDDDKPSRDLELPPRPPGFETMRDAGRRVPHLPEELRARLLDAAAPTSPLSSAVVDRAKLGLAPRPTPPQRIAFAVDRVAQLTESALVVIDIEKKQKVVDTALEAPRRLFGDALGGLVAVDSKRVLQLPRGADEPESYAPLSVFPRSVFVPDRLRADRFWVVHLGSTVYQHELAAGTGAMLPITGLLDLEGFDGRAFAGLPDGSLLWHGGRRLVKQFPGGKSRELALPPVDAEVWRILSASRLDRAWLAYRSGKLLLVALGGEARVVRTVELSSTPFDVASGGRLLAVSRFEKADGGVIAWTLDVFDERGSKRMSVALGTSARSGATRGWVDEETKNRGVAVAPDADYVAVGGPTELSVWSTRTKKRVHPVE